MYYGYFYELPNKLENSSGKMWTSAQVARFGSGKVSAKLEVTHRPSRRLSSDFKQKSKGLEYWDYFARKVLYAELIGLDGYLTVRNFPRSELPQL